MYILNYILNETGITMETSKILDLKTLYPFVLVLPINATITTLSPASITLVPDHRPPQVKNSVLIFTPKSYKQR